MHLVFAYKMYRARTLVRTCSHEKHIMRRARRSVSDVRVTLSDLQVAPTFALHCLSRMCKKRLQNKRGETVSHVRVRNVPGVDREYTDATSKTVPVHRVV